MRRILCSIVLFIFPVVCYSQIITTVAGGGTFTPNGVQALNANIPGPIGGVFDSHGNYYFVGYSTSHRVYKIDTAGIITFFAGTGNGGYNGDGGKADTSMLKQPYGLAIDAYDNVYIADAGNHRVRKVDVGTGIISTVAGNGIGGYSGDNGLAINATLKFSQNICFDKHNNLYIADGQNYRIRVVNASGIITTYAGNGTVGTAGDNGPATLAQVVAYGLCVDDSDNLFFSGASVGQSRISKINAITHIVTKFAGTDTGYIYNGDNILAIWANIGPTTIRFDNTFAELYLTDNTNNRVRKIDANGIIHTVAGNGIQGFGGDNGPALNANLYFPSGLAFDSCGNLFFGDQSNNRIRKVEFNPNCWSVGIKNTNATSIISIYPNPINNELHIDNIKGQAEYKLRNIVGGVMLQGMLNEGNNTIPVHLLSAGMYMVEVILREPQDDRDRQRVVKKIIKQ